MKFCRPLLSAALLGLSMTFASGQEVTSKAVSLEDCWQMALARNLDLRISRYQPQYAGIDLSTAYADWDPRLSAGFRRSQDQSPGQAQANQATVPPNSTDAESYSLDFGGVLPTGLTYAMSGDLGYANTQLGNNPDRRISYRPDTRISLTQPLLKNFWIDRTRLNIAINKQAIQQSEQTVRQSVIRVMTEVSLAYYNLIFSRESVKVQQKALELAERSLLENKKRVEVGAMAPLEEKQAESQVARSRSDLLQAQQRAALAQNTLKELVHDDFASIDTTQLEPASSLTAVPGVFSKQDSWNKGLSLRPDILQSKIDLERQHITLKYTKNQLFPQLDLVGGYGLTGQSTRTGLAFDQITDQRNPNHYFGAQISIPLSNRAARNAHKRAKLQQEDLLLRHKRLEQQIMVDIDNAIREAQTQLQRVESTKQARTYAEAALDAEQKKLENGKSTSFFVLQLQRDLTSAQSAEIGALADYNISLARLAQAEGSTLDQHGVKLEIK